MQLVAHLVDGKLIAPGATFSFNEATGERTAAKGFLEAPVIINGELSTGLGGGVCQVSTTVFNAAYEAGLPITARTNHALYISHYPLGRDATVNYPDVDLKFVNDTGHWLLLRTFVGSSSLVVSLYGTPQHRRVVTETAPLRVVARPPVKKTLDKSLKPGERVVDDYGVPAQATSVRRLVYAPNGKLLSDATWYSSYRAEPKLVRIGPKKHKPKPAGGDDRNLDGRHDDGYDSDGAALAAIAARSQSGVRVGRSVAASTVPWAVQPSAIVVAVALDDVVEAEAGAAHVVAARVHEQAVVEDRRREEARVRLEHERLDPLVAQALVAAGVALEELDAGDLEPHEVVRVVRDALRVGLREAHADRGCEAEGYFPRHTITRASERARRGRSLEFRLRPGKPRVVERCRRVLDGNRA